MHKRFSDDAWNDYLYWHVANRRFKAMNSTIFWQI